MTTWRRGSWLTASAAAAASAVRAARSCIAAGGGMRWTWEPSQAYDALVFAGPIGLQNSQGTAEDRAFSERIWPTRQKFSRVTSRYHMTLEGTPDALAIAFDPLQPRTVSDLLHGVRRAALTAPRPFRDSIADIESGLRDLVAIGFASYWTSHALPRITAQIAARRPEVERTDPAGTVSAFMGVPLDRDVTLLCGAYGSGLRLRKQRFFVNPSWRVDSLLETVTEGLMRKTYDQTVKTDPGVKHAIDALRQDQFLARRVRVTYDLEGWDWYRFVHESVYQALEQLLREHLGIATETPQYRWLTPVTSDLRHVIAPTIYALLRKEGYPGTMRGPFRHTLVRYLAPGGPLSAGHVEATYRRLVGEPPPP